MKKLLLYLFIITTSLILVSCDNTDAPVTQPTCPEGQSYDEILDTCYTVDVTPSNVMVLESTKPIIDLMYYYTLNDASINIYKYNDETTPYINIDDFLTETYDLIVNIDVEYDETYTITYVDELHPYLANLYGFNEFRYDVVFNPIRNSIYVSDLNMYTMINGPTESPASDLILNDLDYEGPAEPFTVYLDDYDMKLIEEDGEFYLPLYLTDLFLTGDLVNIYETDDNIILYDVGSDFEELSTYTEGNQKNDLSVLKESENYLKLLFEYFYGLDTVTEDDYTQLISSLDLGNQTSFNDYYELLDSFLIDIDDLHTSLVFPGYNDDSYEKITEFEDGTRDQLFREAQEYYSCDTQTEEYTLETYGTTTIATVNQFTEFTGALAHQIYLTRDTTETLVIDLRCNSGGSLLGVLELLTTVTSEDIPLAAYNPQTNTYEVQYVQNYTPRYAGATVYVLTSEVTFSGGNLFASIVKDLNAGTIIGTPSTGGACAIGLTTLPDGSIIVYSSNFLLRNTNDEDIEYGIDPDIYMKDLDPTTYDFTQHETN